MVVFKLNNFLNDFASTVDEATVTEFLVEPGQAVRKGQTILLIESSKTVLEIEAPFDGEVQQLHVNIGDLIKTDSDIISILEIRQSDRKDSSNESKKSNGFNRKAKDQHAELVVIGGGPAGYTAAFRAADLGIKTTIIDKYPNLGGTCLNQGCIPSKFLLHIVSAMEEVKKLGEFGVKFNEPFIDLRKMMSAKAKVISTLGGGLNFLTEKRNIQHIKGEARFVSNQSLQIKTSGNTELLGFDQAIIATGSVPNRLPNIDIEDPRIKYSEEALNIQYIPDRLLVIGGGVIGMELSSVYHGLGSRVTLIEASSKILGMIDQDVVTPLLNKFQQQFESIMTNTILVDVDASRSGLKVKLKQGDSVSSLEVDLILIVAGRRPLSDNLNLELIGVGVEDIGCIIVDKNYRTTAPNIFAIGDVIGNPMLAHKGSHEGRKVAEYIKNRDSNNCNSLIPFVVYTDPEIAWTGLNEGEAQESGFDCEKIIVPWSSNGRAITLGFQEGATKLIIDKSTHRLLGAGMVGPGSGEIISELTLAIEKQVNIAELASVIHPHPTLSETIVLGAELYLKEAIEALNA